MGLPAASRRAKYTLLAWLSRMHVCLAIGYCDCLIIALHMHLSFSATNLISQQAVDCFIHFGMTARLSNLLAAQVGASTQTAIRRTCLFRKRTPSPMDVGRDMCGKEESNGSRSTSRVHNRSRASSCLPTKTDPSKQLQLAYLATQNELTHFFCNGTINNPPQN